MPHASGEPLVSVIVPVYNDEQYLVSALESILQQSYRPLEIIVVDDGSTDHSAEKAMSMDGIRYMYQPNRGVAVARNRGIAESRGEYLAFLDQDDRWEPDKLQKQLTPLRRDPLLQYTLSYFRFGLEPSMPQPAWLRDHWLGRDLPGYYPGALVARKRLFDAIGGFNPSLRYGDDTDWFFRAHDAGTPMTFVEDALLYKRIHHGNASHAMRGMKEDLLKLVRDSIARKRQHGHNAGSDALT